MPVNRTPAALRRLGLPLATCAAALALIPACTAAHRTAAGTQPAAKATPSAPAAAPAASPAQQSVTPSPPMAAPARAASASAAASPVTVRYVDASSSGCLTRTGAPLEFSLAISNPSSDDYAKVAPVVATDRYPGGVGPLSIVAATLEQRNDATGAWQPVTLPRTADESTLLASDWPAVALRHGATLVIRYRLTPAPYVGPGSTHLHLSVLDESWHRTLAQAVQPLCFTA